MNKQQLSRDRWEVLKKVRISNRVKNVVRLGKNLSYEHEVTKFNVAWYCKQQGWEYVTEAIFADGSGRADVLILDTDTVVEVIKSEKKVCCIDKSKKYPVETVIIVDANHEFKGEDIF